MSFSLSSDSDDEFIDATGMTLIFIFILRKMFFEVMAIVHVKIIKKNSRMLLIELIIIINCYN